MTEQEFWEIIDALRWSDDHDYKRIKRELMQRFPTPEALKPFRRIFEEKTAAVSNAGDSDHCSDSWSDTVNHIVGLGREEFDRCIADPSLIEARWEACDYQESFSYAVPHDSDYESLTPTPYVKWARENAESFRAVRDASEDDVPWQGKLRPDLDRLIEAHEAFVESGDFAAFVAREAECREGAERVGDILRRINQGWGIPDEGSLESHIHHAANKWAVWNLFTDIHEYGMVA
jgi:hypothetical protein